MTRCAGTRITVLDENFIDILLPSTPRLRRYNMDQHFNARYGELLAENGLCFLVETFTADGLSTTILFDAGSTPARAVMFRTPAGKIEQFLLSRN